MQFAGHTNCMGFAIGKCQVLLVAARAAAKAVYRKTIVIKQAPAKLDFFHSNNICIGYRWRQETGWQIPIEFNLWHRAVVVSLTKVRTRSCNHGDAGDETASPPKTMN